ncbi:MAG: molybdenum cofactor biosynthesis protein B [Oliverpabstia sp.]
MNHRRVAIIVSSDSGYRGEREDLSGPEIRRIAEENDYEIISQVILPDERKILEKEMMRIADENLADLILTTGGTGFSPRDCMPEATLNVSERRVPGIPEAMRAYSMQFTKRAMLSRSEAGIRKQTLIVNLPGSPKAVRECLEYIISELGHGLDILTGEATNCAVKLKIQKEKK